MFRDWSFRNALYLILEHSWDGLQVSHSTSTCSLSLLNFIWPCVYIIKLIYIFSLEQQDIHKQHKFYSVYDSSFCRIFDKEYEFSDASYQKMVCLFPTIIHLFTIDWLAWKYYK